MANFLQRGKPAPDRQLRLAWFAAGMIGLACLGLFGRILYTSPPRPTPPMPLKLAIAEFDAGDLPAAATVFRTLANTGSPHAAYWYGHALDYGLGTPADVGAALVQYRKAWAGGVVQAGRRLGELYLNGNRIPPDFATAHSYLLAAAERGDSRAALDLARMLRQGIGAPADPVAAYAWLEVASLRGNAQARLERDRLLPTLLAAQQTEAVQQASEIMAAGAAKTAAPRAKA